MTASRTVRLAAAAVLGLAAGGALWSRASEIEPYLEIEVDRAARTDEFEWWQIQYKARGGETIDAVRIEAGDGPVLLPPEGSREFRNLRAGWMTGFRAQLNGPPGTKGSVRLVQSGRVSRTYVVPLELKR
jgi:hypothetical protein